MRFGIRIANWPVQGPRIVDGLAAFDIYGDLIGRRLHQRGVMMEVADRKPLRTNTIAQPMPAGS
jgi:hypothetical protein